MKQRPVVVLTDLPVFGRPVRLAWHKTRYACPEATCPHASWTPADERIAAPRTTVTQRAGRWATEQVGRFRRAVSAVAGELGCDWHTVNDAVLAYGRQLVEHPDRIGQVEAIGLDETLFTRTGTYRRREWATTIADVSGHRLIDITPGRDAGSVVNWLSARPQSWLDAITVGTLDMAATYRSVYRQVLPQAMLVADPFHVVRLANTCLDQFRRWVQNTVLGHRGHKTDPLSRARRLLTKAAERLDEAGTAKLRGLAVGDPDGHVSGAWQAKEAVRAHYTIPDPATAADYLDALSTDLRAPGRHRLLQRLGRTLATWSAEILAWHTTGISNGPTEGQNNLIKAIKRVGFGFRNSTTTASAYSSTPAASTGPSCPPSHPAEIRRTCLAQVTRTTRSVELSPASRQHRSFITSLRGLPACLHGKSLLPVVKWPKIHGDAINRRTATPEGEATMPAAIDIALSVPGPAAATPTARQLHAAVACMLSEAEGDHKSPIKPFSVWPLHSTQYEPDRLRLRVGWLAASPPPTPLLQCGSPWRIGSLQARAADVTVEPRSFGEFAATPAVDKVVLHALTSTVFARQDRRFPMPDPFLIYGGLIDRWNTYTADFEIGTEARRGLLGSLEIKDFDIHPERMLVDRTRQFGREAREIWRLGFAGAVTVGLIPGSPDLAGSLLAGLSEFARFSGIGSGTTRGFGACIPELVRQQEPAYV